MPKRPHVVVIGSSNTDMVVRAPRLPRPGETVLGNSFAMVPGGKGANQAVAAARLGAQVTLIARIGSDLFGDSALRGFETEGIETQYIARDPTAPSGVALIGVDETTGENAIMVAPAANGRLSVGDVEKAQDVIAESDILVCQLEVPLAAVATALTLAREAGVITLLNPAPAQPLPDELLRFVSYLTPNEAEAAQLVGMVNATPAEAAALLRARGVENVVVTLGAGGALLVTREGEQPIAGRNVSGVVDTTAAGDCFTAALAVALGERHSLEYAAQFANSAAALCVTKPGAQPSLPTRAQVKHFQMD